MSTIYQIALIPMHAFPNIPVHLSAYSHRYTCSLTDDDMPMAMKFSGRASHPPQMKQNSIMMQDIVQL